MSLSITTRTPRNDDFNSGLVQAVVLHIAVAAVIIGAAYLKLSNHEKWGENASTAGAIQASMVSALPLPPKVKPVEKQVLAADDTSDAPKPPPREATVTPPKPTDIPIKGTPPKPVTKTAPVETPAPPKHAVPTPETTKATTGSQATQLPQSITQMKSGTATLTVQNKTFGDRYAYYIRIVGQKTNESWNEQPIDPRSTHSKSVSVRFDIDRDGHPTNVHVVSTSGVPTIDTAAVRAIERIDGFGPPPPVAVPPIEYKFDYN